MSAYMEMALALAAGWRGRTSPNPLVGAVVVKDGRVVGKGAHQKAGEPHAEVHALNDAGGAAEGGTLYVNLEPCSHFGKTPPCTERIIAGGIKKVVAAMADPNPLVAGRGIARLREAGIEVEVGDCAEEACWLNEVFVKYITTRTPFVTLKAAVSLDGKIAACTGDSKWITNAPARQRVHELRNETDAVLVGKGTVMSDNPRLNVRLPGDVRDPRKILLTTRLADPETVRGLAVYQLSQAKPLIMVGAERLAPASRVAALRAMGIDVILLPVPAESPEAESGLGPASEPGSGEARASAVGVDLHCLMSALGQRQITSLLLEGGSGVYTGFLRAGLVDRVLLFQAPIVLGGDGKGWTQVLGVKSVAQAKRLRHVQYLSFGDDLLIQGDLLQSGSANGTEKEG